MIIFNNLWETTRVANEEFKLLIFKNENKLVVCICEHEYLKQIFLYYLQFNNMHLILLDVLKKLKCDTIDYTIDRKATQ